MTGLAAYGVVALAVLALNLVPAFGPPTWAVLVLFSLHVDVATPPLVVVGAVSAAAGRYLLARATRRLGARIPARQRDNLSVAGDLLTRRRSRTYAFLALFLLSPLPSAQLFEAAALMPVRLAPLTAAFFLGRLGSYALYLAGAAATSATDTGQVLLANLTSPWALVVEVVMLAMLVGLARIDWRRLAARSHAAGSAQGREAGR